MYAPLYCRLCGWLFTAFGLAGLIWGRLGQLLHFRVEDAAIYLVLGIIGMGAARSRHRNAVLASLFCGLLLLAWGMAGMAWPDFRVIGGEPLENAIRVVAGFWGLYVSVQDVLTWRSESRSEQP
ncbi:MAG: hypothetical protein K6T83_23775 [Alicyclobacillus sp.]|nr:hypothetical protein [Alicyclobacillus sp.]